MEKALSAIIKNAIVYNRQISTESEVTLSHLRVTLSHLHPHVQITITDTGIGIAPEFHDKVFEKFAHIGNRVNA